MSFTALAVFVFTYFVISARRLNWLPLDRPAGALVGAVTCVAVGVLTLEEAVAAVDSHTLLLLFGVMGMGAFLSVDGFFEQLESRLVAWAGTPARLLGALVWGAGVLSAFITNDAVCILGAPVVVRLVRRHGLPPLPFLLALATAANTGSVATLVGNPQNMLCGILGGLSYWRHLVALAPVALVALAINHGLLAFMFREALRGARLERVEAPGPLGRRSWLTLAVIGGSAGVYALGGDMAGTAVAGLVLLIILHRRETQQLWPRIDWSLLLFFAGLFVVVEGLVQGGVPRWLFERFPFADGEMGTWGWLRLSGIFLAGSNLVSNVPFILVVRSEMGELPDVRLGWELLAMASTFAGNLTLLGSAANIIVAEASREVGGLGFWAYLKVGFPLAVTTTLIGALWLVFVFPNG